MKRYVLFITLIVLLVNSLMGCSTDSNELMSIEGTWQAYASMVDDEITPFEDIDGDEEALEQLINQTLTFNDDGTVIFNNGYTDLNGTYEPLRNGYLVKVPFGNSGETAEFTCTIYEEELVVTLIIPEGFEDDTGYSTVYRKAD